MTRLKLALTKGRLEKQTIELFERGGLDCTPLRNPGRRLVHSLPNYPLDIVLAKAPDVITYVEHGVCDIGVVGKDTILEHGRSFYEVLDLGFGRCRFALAAPKETVIYGAGLRIATKYPTVTKNYCDSKRISAEIIKIEGSVELAPLVGLADAIVDIVETGATLRENGLEILDDIFDISARMIVNIASMKINRAAVDELVALSRDSLAGGAK